MGAWYARTCIVKHLKLQRSTGISIEAIRIPVYTKNNILRRGGSDKSVPNYVIDNSIAIPNKITIVVKNRNVISSCSSCGSAIIMLAGTYRDSSGTLIIGNSRSNSMIVDTDAKCTICSILPRDQDIIRLTRSHKITAKSNRSSTSCRLGASDRAPSSAAASRDRLDYGNLREHTTSAAIYHYIYTYLSRHKTKPYCIRRSCLIKTRRKNIRRTASSSISCRR